MSAIKMSSSISFSHSAASVIQSAASIAAHHINDSIRALC